MAANLYVESVQIVFRKLHRNKCWTVFIGPGNRDLRFAS